MPKAHAIDFAAKRPLKSWNLCYPRPWECGCGGVRLVPELLKSAQEGGTIHACPRLRNAHGDAEKPARCPEGGGRPRRARGKLVRPIVHAVLCRRQRRRSDHENSRCRQWIANRRRLAEGGSTLSRADQG